MARTSATVTVEGTKIILWHTFPLDTFDTDKKKSGKTGDNSEEWKDTVLMDENRQLFVYGTYFQSSIAEGAKEIKSGRGNISKKVSSTLEIIEERIFMDNLFVPEEKDLAKGSATLDKVFLDMRAVVNPMTKGRNLRYRIAAKPGWTCQFTIAWDDRIVSKDQIKLSVENAGMLQGIGDARKIGYGRFKVIDFVNQK